MTSVPASENFSSPSTDWAGQSGADRARLDAVRARARATIASIHVNEQQWDEGFFPWEAHRLFAQAGLVGLTLPSSHEGGDGTRAEAVALLEEVATTSFTLAEALQLCVSGPSFLLGKLANDRVRDQHLREVARGTRLITIAITERQAGSSLAEVETRFERVPDGIMITGEKVFVTGAPLAGAHLVLGRFGGEGLAGLGCVLVDAKTPGVTLGETWRKIGGNGLPECIVRFDHALVPAENVIISGSLEDRVGLRRTLEFYATMRLGIAAICLGVGTAAMRETARVLKDRRQFGQRLADFQGLRWRFARLGVRLEAARALTYSAALHTNEHGFPDPHLASMAKLVASEFAIDAADEAIQVAGWRGIVHGAQPGERLFRQVRPWAIAGGSNETVLNGLASEFLRRF